jgi:16S rRNA (uracil1498-N3)-methyltransferase
VLLRLPPEESRHATKTLRLREGDRLELCDGRGYVVLAEITGVDRAGAAVQTVGAPLAVARSGWQWEVACACGSLKGGRSDWLVEKCAELGAAAFTPLLTHRSPAIGSGGSGGGSADDDPRPSAARGKRAGRRRGEAGRLVVPQPGCQLLENSQRQSICTAVTSSQPHLKAFPSR